MTSSSLQPAAVYCTACGRRLPGDRYNTGQQFSCSCGARLTVDVFPALFRADQVKSGEGLTAEGEASCYYHPGKKAATLCAACGRFLCSLCETELAGRCLCPSCIEKGRVEEGIEQLVTHRTLHDSIALSTAVLPLLFFPVTIITAPAACFIAIRYWNRHDSILPRTRIRYLAAIVLSLLQIAGWLAFLFFRKKFI